VCNVAVGWVGAKRCPLLFTSIVRRVTVAAHKLLPGAPSDQRRHAAAFADRSKHTRAPAVAAGEARTLLRGDGQALPPTPDIAFVNKRRHTACPGRRLTATFAAGELRLRPSVDGQLLTSSSTIHRPDAICARHLRSAVTAGEPSAGRHAGEARTQPGGDGQSLPPTPGIAFLLKRRRYTTCPGRWLTASGAKIRLWPSGEGQATAESVESQAAIHRARHAYCAGRLRPAVTAGEPSAGCRAASGDRKGRRGAAGCNLAGRESIGGH
jgi:hypothetical protein